MSNLGMLKSSFSDGRVSHPVGGRPRLGGGPQPDSGQSVLRHYLELLRYHWRLATACTLALGLAATALAVLMLLTNPLYRATAKVTVQPSDAELRFTQSFVRSSSYDSANVVTQSHMEYLRSREIAARAYEVLSAAGGGTGEEEQPGVAARIASGAKLALRSTYRWLNSGDFVRVTGPEAVIAQIQDSIEVNMIESSFLMEIAVYWDDPDTAAEIANILASVYQDRFEEQSAASTAQLVAFLEERRASVQARIEDLTAERDALRAEWGVIDFAAERTALINRVSAETANLDDDRAALMTAEATVAALSPLDSESRRTGLDPVTERELALARVATIELRQGIVEREAILETLRAELQRYASYEEPLGVIQDALQRENARLDDIDSRLLTTQIAESESLETLRIVDQARPPLYPDSPQVLKQGIIGGVAGFVLAIGLIVGRDLFSQTLVTRADLEEATGLPVLDARRGTRPGEPYLGWEALEAGGEILVLDWNDENRADQIAMELLGHPPSDLLASCGLLRHARRRGYIMPDTAAILITLGQGEATSEDLAPRIAHLRQMVPGVPMAIQYAAGPSRTPARPLGAFAGRGADTALAEDPPSART